MKTPHLRQLLRKHTDGLTIKDLARLIESSRPNTLQALKAMPDAYVDRWEGPNRGQYAAVWCVVVPPENCPHPTRKEPEQ